jgi:hypothetical protein
MRAFVCEIDHHGLRRLRPEDLLSAEEIHSLARGPSRRRLSVIWALLEEPDAEDLRAEVEAGRCRGALGLLLNRAIELIHVAAALTGPSPPA